MQMNSIFDIIFNRQFNLLHNLKISSAILQTASGKEKDALVSNIPAMILPHSICFSRVSINSAE